MEEEGRNILLPSEPLAVTPPDSIGSGLLSAMAPSPTSAGYQSAQSGNDEDDDGGPSPVDTNSFHTASSIEGSAEHFETVPLGSKEVSPSPPPTASRVYNLPPGFESQPKLEINEESIRPIEKQPLPDDSILERISRARDSTSYEHRRRPSIDVPNETTPLVTQNSYRSDVSSGDGDNSCCILI